MKITNDELLQLVWLQQLQRLAGGVVHTYFGDKFGLKEDCDFFFRNASKVHRLDRAKVTTLLSSDQLLARLRKLGASGRLWVCPEFGDFMFDNEGAQVAYRAAREYWINEGVMEYPHQPRALSADRFARLKAECQQLLLARYSGAQQVAA